MRIGTKVGFALTGLTVALTGCKTPIGPAIREALAENRLSEGACVLPKEPEVPLFGASQEGEGGDLTRTY